MTGDLERKKLSKLANKMSCVQAQYYIASQLFYIKKYKYATGI